MLAQCLIGPCWHRVWSVHVGTVFDWSMLHRVERLAQDISRDLPGPLVALCVLKGGYQFFSDLLNFIKSNNSFAGGWVWWSHMQLLVASWFCEHFHCFSSEMWLNLWTHYTEQCSVHCTHYTEQCSVHCTHYVVLRVLNSHCVWFLMKKQGDRTVLSCAFGIMAVFDVQSIVTCWYRIGTPWMRKVFTHACFRLWICVALTTLFVGICRITTCADTGGLCSFEELRGHSVVWRSAGGRDW